MATNILLQFVPDGLNALQAQIANGDATRITRYELTEETITGTTWNPSVYYRQDNPQDIGAVSLYNAVDAPNTQQVLVMDLLLNQTVPLNTAYTSVNAGWVNSSTNPAIINLLNFCLFIYDPVSGVDVPFLIGTFLNIDTQLPQAVLKFSNNYIANLPGNVLDIFNNTKLTPTNPDSIQYEIVQRPDAQIRYINQGIELLPTPTANTPNAYVINTYNTLAWSNYYLWYFSNYYDEISDSSVIGITGTTFNSPDLAAKVNIYPEEIFVEPNVIGEIYGSNGIMKKCFYITGISGSIFSTSATLPTFEAGDMIKVFFSLAKIAGKNFLKLTTQSATSVLSTSATLNGTLISFINSTTNLTGFDYKKTTDTNYTRVGMVYNDVLGPYTYNLSGLDLSTTYQYRAVGTDTNNQFTSFGEVVQFTTGSVTPPVFDFQLNITGTVDGPSNIALNTTNIPDVVNGAVNNATGLMTATANNCASNSLEVYQSLGTEMTVDGTSTTTTLVLTSSQSGLITSGDDIGIVIGGNEEIVNCGNVVETPVDNSGAAWNQITYPNPQANFLGGTYTENLFIFCQGSGRILISSNGNTFSSVNVPTAGALYYPIFVNGNYLLGGSGNATTSLFASTDGITWTAVNNGGISSVNFVKGAYDGIGRIIFINIGNLNYTTSTDDGATWTVLSSLPFAAGTICHGDGKWVAILQHVMTSTNGTTWTDQGTPFGTGTGTAINDIIYADGLFVAVGTQANKAAIFTSTDAISWTNVYLDASTGTSLNCINYGNGIFVAGSNITTEQVFTSVDGSTWNTTNIGISPGHIVGVGCGNGKWVAASGVGGSATWLAGSDAGIAYQYTCTSLNPSPLSGIPTQAYADYNPPFTAIEPLFAYNPYKLTIDPSTTSTSIVVTDSQSGLLTNGSQLIVDDGGTMKIVQVGSVVEINTTNFSVFNLVTSPNFPSGSIPSGFAFDGAGNGVMSMFNTSVGTRYYFNTLNNGGTWNLVGTNTTINWLNQIVYIGSNTWLGIPSSEPMKLYKSTNLGVSWSPITMPPNPGGYVSSVVVTLTYQSGTILAIMSGGNGYIYRSTNGGTSWTIFDVSTIAPGINATASQNLMTLATFGGGIWLATGFTGAGNQTILRSIDDGVSWSTVTISTVGTAGLSTMPCACNSGGLSVIGGNSNGFNAFIFKSTDFGVTWSSTSVSVGNSHVYAVANNGSNIWLIGGQAGAGRSIAYSMDNATSWNYELYATIGIGFDMLRIITNDNTFYAQSGTFGGSIAGNIYTSSVIYTYTCTSLTSVFGTVPLSNAPTWCAKGGQVFQSAVYTTTNPTPTYTTDTIDSLTRSTDTLTITMTQRPATGRYVRVKTIVNNQDIMSRYAANLYI